MIARMLWDVFVFSVGAIVLFNLFGLYIIPIIFIFACWKRGQNEVV